MYVFLVLGCWLLAGCVKKPSLPVRQSPELAGNATLIAAAGDIACDPQSRFFNRGNGTSDKCHMQQTSDLILRLNPDVVLALGDTQYEKGTKSAYADSYDPTWGRFKTKTRPALGNHEYWTADAHGYFEYFGEQAGSKQHGFYSFDAGGWHFIALNSNCNRVGGCGQGSPQMQWLRQDLESHRGQCTIAYWHHPRFSSGLHGSNSNYQPFWELLYAAKADVVLAGHDHDYERFAPMEPSGKLNVQGGIREFVVGTGGKNLRGFVRSIPTPKFRNRNSEVRFDEFGVLELALTPATYQWRFVSESGKILDWGTNNCHSVEH
jgi:hypothetical protein